jgi:hypothetical protein
MAGAERDQAKGAPEWISAYLADLQPRLVLAELLFGRRMVADVATALELVPFVPTAVWLPLIVLGLLLGKPPREGG